MRTALNVVALSSQHNISVPMGDRVRVAEKETSYAGSFSWPPACRSAANLISFHCMFNL